MQTLFRGNSLASKIMAYCFRFYGQQYLRELLNPLIMEMLRDDRQQPQMSYEIDPARSVKCPKIQILSGCWELKSVEGEKTYTHQFRD